MSMESSVYLGFADDVNSHTQNMSSITWVIYSSEGQLVSSSGVRLEPSTNNVAEYSSIIELLHDAISHGFRSL
jgi:ribonuclease HI